MRCMPKGHTTMGALRACRFGGVPFSEAGELIQAFNLQLSHSLSPALGGIRSRLMCGEGGIIDSRGAP